MMTKPEHVIDSRTEVMNGATVTVETVECDGVTFERRINEYGFLIGATILTGGEGSGGNG